MIVGRGCKSWELRTDRDGDSKNLARIGHFEGLPAWVGADEAQIGAVLVMGPSMGGGVRGRLDISRLSFKWRPLSILWYGRFKESPRKNLRLHLGNFIFKNSPAK